MSQENVEVAKAFYEAWNAGDMDAVRQMYHPDVIVRLGGPVRQLAIAPDGLGAIGQSAFQPVDLGVETALFGAPALGGGFEFFLGLFLLPLDLLQPGFKFGFQFFRDLFP